jgi:hypothetical protein
MDVPDGGTATRAGNGIPGSSRNHPQTIGGLESTAGGCETAASCFLGNARIRTVTSSLGLGKLLLIDLVDARSTRGVWPLPRGVMVYLTAYQLIEEEPFSFLAEGGTSLLWISIISIHSQIALSPKV